MAYRGNNGYEGVWPMVETPWWSYPRDAYQRTAWPAVENASPNIWPVFYEPPGYEPRDSPLEASYDEYAQEYDPTTYDPTTYVGDASWFNPIKTAQEFGQRLGQIPGAIAAPIIDRKMGDVSDKATDAADAIKTQANQVGDEARRTLAMAQASMIAANKHIEETSRHAQSTAEVTKYVIGALGALGTVALIFHIIKQSSD